ncbi:monovalent cation/H(+) antiporter subunit G [Pontibacter locisalis]|uniref:Monovalent cation/H(+) antiporter subunit G n=1 Tax=Pontibacter locisalis TaxID=1719035 RepID=A0ABW5IRF8_9BACT
MFSNFDLNFIKEIISCILIMLGVILMLISTIGLLRFPDFYIRMSAITKGATLGLGLILLGMGIYFNQPDILLKVLAIIFFVFLTAPVAAHVIGRTAVQNRTPFWVKTNLKEFEAYLQKAHLDKVKLHDKYEEEEIRQGEKPNDGGDNG